MPAAEHVAPCVEQLILVARERGAQAAIAADPAAAAAEAAADSALPPMELLIGVDSGGGTATFAHAAGGDLAAEAAAFCAASLPAADAAHCAQQLKAAARAKGAELAASGGGGGAAPGAAAAGGGAAVDDGAAFFESLLGATLVRGGAHAEAGTSVATRDALGDARVVALLFAADWCGPCKQFTPLLAKYYDFARRARKKLEVVWISGSRSQGGFDGYLRSMPWIAAPFDQRALQGVGQVCTRPPRRWW